MSKSNRKGYFVKQLKLEGLAEDNSSNSHRKGIRKQPKVAAKEARERKKVYISHMEEKLAESSTQIEKLLQENEELKNECLELRQQIGKMNNKIGPNSVKAEESTSKTASRFEGLFKEIGSLSVNLKNNNKEEVTRNLSVLRDKYGISGRERLKSIDDEFDKIITTMMPMHYRLLMEHADNNKEFYSLLGSQYANNHLLKLQERERQILINVRPQIIRQREEYDKIIYMMGELRGRVKTQNYRCQSIVDEIEDRVDPMFVGRLLLDLDFCRGKENLEVLYPMNYWNKVKDEVIDSGLHIRKNEQEQIEQPLFRFEEDLEILNELFS